MNNESCELNKEIKKLCIEYIEILEKLKLEKIINEDEFNDYTHNKLIFLER